MTEQLTSKDSYEIALQRRITRRILLVAVVILTLVAIAAIAFVQIKGRQNLHIVTGLALGTITNTITHDLEEPLYELSRVATSTAMRDYARVVRLAQNLDLTEEERILQSDVLRAMDNIVSRQRNLYLGVRYITRENFVIGEVANNDGITRVVSQPRQVDLSNDLGYTTALGSVTPGSAFLGTVIPATQNRPATLNIYAPVNTAAGSARVEGVLQMTISVEPLAEALTTILQNPVVEQIERQILLVDNSNRVIADTNREQTETLALSPFLALNTGNFVQVPHNAVVVSGSTLEGFSGVNLPWRVIVVDDLSLVTSTMNIFSGLIILAYLLVLAGLRMGINIVLQPVLRPLVSAADIAQRLASGGALEETSPKAPSSSQDELGSLLGSMDNISRRINQLGDHLESQVSRRNRDLEVAARIGREMATLHDFDSLINGAIKLICDEFGFYHAQVFFIDDAELNAVLAYSRGEVGRKLLEQNFKIAIGSESVIGTVTVQRQPVIINDTTRRAEVVHRFNPMLPETRAEMALPLFIGERLIGVLDIQSKEPDVFREEDLPAFNLIADQLAIAIYNAQLASQTQTRMQQIDTLNRQLTRAAWDKAGQQINPTRGYQYNLLNVQPLTPTENGHVTDGLSSLITIRGEVIGTLKAEPSKGEELTEGDRVILQSVADRVALAIENARLFQETQSTLAETSVLYQLTRSLNEANTLEDIIQAIITTAMPEAIGGQVWIFDEYNTGDTPLWVEVTADLALGRRSKSNESLKGLRLHLPDHPLLRTMQGDKIALVNNARKDSRMDNGLKLVFRRMNAEAGVIIPLTVRGWWRGLIMIEFDEVRQFTEQDGRVATALIDQAGVAIDNRLLLQQTEEEVTRNENLYAASRIINTAQNIQDLVFAAVATSRDPLLNFSLSLLEGELDETGWPTTARLVARSQDGTVYEDDFVYPVEIAPDSPMRERAPETTIDDAPNLPTNSPSIEWMRTQGFRYVVKFPLFSANQPIALFVIASTEIRDLSTTDYEVYRALTAQMSSQIQIRRLLERTEQALDETRRLFIASRAITSAQDSNAIYAAAADHLARPFSHAQAGRAQRSIKIALLLAWPHPEPTTPYLEYAHIWSNAPHPIDSYEVGDKVFSEDYPYARLTSETGGIIHFEDVQQASHTDEILKNEPRLSERLFEDGTNSLLIAPVTSRQKWYGVVVVESDYAHTFNEQYLRFVAALADQIGIAVDNQRLFQEARIEAERAQSEAQRALALAEAAQLANRIGDDFETGLGDVFKRVAEVAGFDRWMLLFLDAEGKQLNKITARVPSLDQTQPFSYPLPETDQKEIGIPVVDVLHINRSLTINELPSYPAFAAFSETERQEMVNFFGKHIAIPVRVGIENVGAMFVGRSLEQEDLDERDEQLVETLAAQVAVAVENRRLFQRVQNEQQTLRSILETLPAGVLVLDPATFKPVQFNEQAQVYLRREIDPSVPFEIKTYNLYRTGTELLYPQEEMPIFAAFYEATQKSRDDVAVVVDGEQTDLLIDAAPVTDARGNITAIVAAFQDISNLRSLENTLQENLRETVALYEAQRQLSEAGSLDDVLEVLLGQLTLAFPTDAYIILQGDNQEIYTARHMVNPMDRPEKLEAALHPREIVRVNDVRKSHLSRAVQETLEKQGVRSFLSIPMRASTRDKVFGWVMVVSDQPGGFSSNQEPLLTQLSDMASTSIDNRFLIQTQEATLREIGALYNANTNISRARNAEDLTSVLQEALASLSPDYYAGYLDSSTGLQSANEELFNVAAEGLSTHDFGPIIVDHALPMGGLYIDDLHAVSDPGPMQSSLIAAGIRSVAAIHLRPKDSPGGFLIIAYRKRHRFTDSESRFLNTIADSASIVFNNIILFDQIQGALEETSILYQASRTLSNASTPEEILDVVANYLILPHINHVFIALLSTGTWDAPNATVQIVASWNSDEGIDVQGLTLSHEQFPAWRQLSSPAVLTIDDAETEEDLSPMEQMSLESLDARSLIVIPLRVTNRTIGAIWISSRETHLHHEREVRTYQAFAEQASLSLEASYLLQQTDRRARQLETSAQVSQSAGQILDLEVLLPQVVDLIRDSFGYDHVQVFLLDEAENFAELRASTGEAGRQLLAIRHKLQKGSDSVIGQVTAKGTPQIALDTADASVIHQPNPYLPLTRSEMALPLIIKDRVIGALDVQSNQPNAFSDEDVKVLTTLAAQISIAIDNANLYQATQEQADKMGFLFEITTAAAAADTLDDALQNVVERLHSMLDALSVAVYLPRLYIDDRQNTLTTFQVVALAGTDQPLSELEEVRADDAASIISEVARLMQPFVVENIAREERYLPLVASANSAVILPLAVGGELIGLIVLEDQHVNAYNYDALQLLLTLAGSLSAIIQSSLLLEQLTKTNEQLRELDRIKSDFLANMSHELRTPLNSIIGFSRVMLKGIDGPLTEMQEQDLTTIYNSGQHLLMLINDVLDQAKIAAGKMDMKFAFFEIKPLIEAVKSIGVGLVKDKPINMQVELAPNLPHVYGDEFRTRQVMLNLVSNAAKFTMQGSITIRVYLVESPDYGKYMVQIDVEDTGIGIAEKDQPLLFEAFQQVDSSLTRTQGGTGLGLPIAKSLIEMQGGQMYVKSQVNVGSVFSVTLPTEPTVDVEDGPDDDIAGLEEILDASTKIDALIRPSLEPQPISMSLNGPGNKVIQLKREILLIEDNKDMVDQFRRILQREGFEVQTADHPAYAEAMVSNLRPTLIVMDVDFAGGDGWDILARLKDRDDTFDIPVIVVTLNPQSERAYQIGAHSFIQRPFIPEDLVKAALEAEKESNTERILIIDDQPDSVRLLTQLLNQNGTYRVFSASSGLEGISLVARRRPNLIILDLRMPEMDGFAVLRELRANPETASIPIMVVTGDIDLNASEMQQLANVHVLHKADISEEDFERFIGDVRNHLDVHEES